MLQNNSNINKNPSITDSRSRDPVLSHANLPRSFSDSTILDYQNRSTLLRSKTVSNCNYEIPNSSFQLQKSPTVVYKKGLGSKKEYLEQSPSKTLFTSPTDHFNKLLYDTEEDFSESTAKSGISKIHIFGFISKNLVILILLILNLIVIGGVVPTLLIIRKNCIV